MFSINNKRDGEVKAPDAHSHTPPGADGWKDVLQLLKEQNKKMVRLARALSVIQQGMLRNNPGHVEDSVSESSEVLSGMLSTHKCLLKSGVEIKKRLESHPASKKMGTFRRLRSASLGDTPKKLTKGKKRVAPSPLEDRLAKKGKGGISPTSLRPPGAKPQKKMGNSSWWRRKKRKKEKKKKLGRCSPAARLGDAIRVLAKDEESYADILKAMTPKMQGWRSSPFGEPGGRRSFWSSERGVTSRPLKRRLTRRSGRRPKLNLWSRRGPLKLGTSTRQSQEKRLLARYASH